MNKRPWTKQEVALLRSQYGRTPAAQIARRLGRPTHQVYGAAERYGCQQPKAMYSIPVLKSYIVQKHAEQWSDAEIAAGWKACGNPAMDRRTLREWRVKLGLPSNAKTERLRKRVAENTRRQLAAAGVASLADLRSKAYQDFAVSRGWPEWLRPRHVQILDVLYEHGPQTRLQLATAIGWRVERGQRALFSSVYGRGSYLADLLAAGLIGRSAGREVRGPTKGTSVHRYFVLPQIVRSQPATWPDKEFALGQIYRNKPQYDPRGNAAGDAVTGGSNVSGQAAGGRVRLRQRGRRRSDRQGNRRASQVG